MEKEEDGSVRYILQSNVENRTSLSEYQPKDSPTFNLWLSIVSLVRVEEDG